MILVTFSKIKVSNLPDIGLIKRKPNPKVEIKLRGDNIVRKTQAGWSKRTHKFKESITFIIPRSRRELVFELDVSHSTILQRIMKYDTVGKSIVYRLNPHTELSFDIETENIFYVVNPKRIDSTIEFSVKKTRPQNEVFNFESTHEEEENEENEGEMGIEEFFHGYGEEEGVDTPYTPQESQQQEQQSLEEEEEDDEVEEEIHHRVASQVPIPIPIPLTPEVEEELVFSYYNDPFDFEVTFPEKNEEAAEKKKPEKQKPNKEEEEEVEGNNSLKKKLEEMEKKLEEIKDEKLCVACCEANKDSVLIPCGHLCLCYQCAWKIDRKCPICRSRVRKVLKVFL